MNAKVAIPAALLFITQFNHLLFGNDSCLTSHFYGNFRDGRTTQSVFIPDTLCLRSWASRTLPPYATIVQNSSEIQRLVWLEEEAVDASLKTEPMSPRHEFDTFLNILSTLTPSSDGFDSAQGVLAKPGYELLYHTGSAALLSVGYEQAKMIDTILPRFWRSTLVPTSSIIFQPVPAAAAKHVGELLSKLKFNPVVASIVNSISISQMRDDLRFLTGEDGTSGITSRHSFSPGALTASSWLKARFEDTGALCGLKPFSVGFAPNVVCRYPAVTDTNATVLLSAHYDSRGSFGRTRAPGGDDDGSGTAALLSIARTISQKGVRFHSNVELVAFAGEEQGLLGSRAYAQELKAAKTNLILMVQADMLAYRAPGEHPQLGLPDTIGSPEVTQLVANVSAIYSPELRVGFTPACCSDHQSFHEQGFPSTQVFERAGPIIDPMYHNSGDLSERIGFDFEQLRSIAKVQFATVLHAAGFQQSQ